MPSLERKRQTARTVFGRMRSRSWTGRDDPLDERFTVAEMLSLCAAILTSIGLLSLPIVLHFLEKNVR